MLRKQNQPLQTGTLIPFADGRRCRRRKILAIRSIVNIWFRRRNRGLSTEIKQPVNRLLPYTLLLFFALRSIERGKARPP